MYLQEFLKKEFSEENIEFWKACESYKSVIDSNFVSTQVLFCEHITSMV